MPDELYRIIDGHWIRVDSIWQGLSIESREAPADDTRNAATPNADGAYITKGKA